MLRFGWLRLACLFLVLTVIAALVRDGGAEARSLAARVPDAMLLAPENPEETPAAPRTEGQLSALEDLSEDALQMDAAPEPKPRPVPRKEEQGRPAGEKARPDLSSASRSGPPVFYRPAGPDTPAGSGPVCGDLRDAPRDGRIVFPLERQFFFSYADTWGAPRTQGGHEGTDLMTPSGVPEYAITDGTVVPVAGSDADGWNTLGGHAVMVRADYSMGPVEAGDLFYYAHLERESPLRIGDRVNAGQVVGYAGDTGQGPPGTSGLFPPHLHLGWYDGTGGREEAPSGAMNPYPLLEWIKSNGGAVTGDSEARFCEAPRTGPPTPSAHDGAWPTPANPGLSPDLSTGDPRPNPTTQKNAPAKKPPRPDHPKKTRGGTPPKPSGEHRQEEPTRSERPGPDRQTERPDPGKDDHTLPKDELPEDELPEDELPEDELPEDELPEDELPKDELPKDQSPKDELPKDKSPKDQSPEKDPPNSDHTVGDHPEAPPEAPPEPTAPGDDEGQYGASTGGPAGSTEDPRPRTLDRGPSTGR